MPFLEFEFISINWQQNQRVLVPFYPSLEHQSSCLSTRRETLSTTAITMGYPRDIKEKGRAVEPGGPAFPNGRGGSQGGSSFTNSGPQSDREKQRMLGAQQQAPNQAQRVTGRPFFTNNVEGSSSSSRCIDNEHSDNSERFHNTGGPSSGMESKSSMGSNINAGPKNHTGPYHPLGHGRRFDRNDNKGQIKGIDPTRNRRFVRNMDSHRSMGPPNGIESNNSRGTNSNKATSYDLSLQGRGMGPMGNTGPDFNIPPNDPIGLNNRRGSTASTKSDPYKDDAPLTREPLDILLSIPLIPSADFDHNTRFSHEELEHILKNISIQEQGNGSTNTRGIADSAPNGEIPGGSAAFDPPSFGDHNDQNAARPSLALQEPSKNTGQSQDTVNHHSNSHNAPGSSVFYHQPFTNRFQSQNRRDPYRNGFHTARPSINYPQPLPDGHQPQHVDGTGSNNGQELTIGYAMMPHLTVAPGFLSPPPIGNGFHPGSTMGTGGSAPAIGELSLSATAAPFIPRESTLERILLSAGVVDAFSPVLQKDIPAPFAPPESILDILRHAGIEDALYPRVPGPTALTLDNFFIPDDHVSQNERNAGNHSSVEPLGSAILGGQPLGPSIRLCSIELLSFTRAPGGYDRRPTLDRLLEAFQFTPERQTVKHVRGDHGSNYDDEQDHEPEDEPSCRSREVEAEDSEDADECPSLRKATTNSLPPTTPPQMAGEPMQRGVSDPQRPTPILTAGDVQESERAGEALGDDVEVDEEPPAKRSRRRKGAAENS